MSKTRKTYRHSKLPQDMCTFHGLHNWHKAMFEKLGWMVLAKAKGLDYKIQAYKKTVDHLIQSIEHLMAEYRDADHIHDLNVLHMNAMCLQGFIAKSF